MKVNRFLCLSRLLTALLWLSQVLNAQTLEDQLAAVPLPALAEEAREQGDAIRGAIVFFQPQQQCSRCHSVSGSPSTLPGPDLASLDRQTTDESLVESVLQPSKVIRRGYESVSVVLNNGQTITGIPVSRDAAHITLRDAARQGELQTLNMTDVDEVVANTVSLMPAGQVSQFSSRQQFLDLIRYLIELRDGGAARAAELQPSPALITFRIPDYEADIDHAGLIRDWNAEAYQRGEAIYRRVCMNCHGTVDTPGSLPTSLKFAQGRFRNGSDPHAMYQTLTRGFGLMAAQSWMVPSQKYDVIHYIRETFLRPHNPSQLTGITDEYLAGLPRGSSRGPEPDPIQPWFAMDYGPTLTHTYEVPGQRLNLAYKGIALRLDPGAGGVSRGRHWMIFDTDTLRMAAAWSAPDKSDAASNFIDWRGVQFNGEHQIHPTITGTVTASAGPGPGWAEPQTGRWDDDQRVVGRDGRRYGPLPRSWGRYRGMYVHGMDTVLSYEIGGTSILEKPGLLPPNGPSDPPVFLRTFNIGPRRQELRLLVAEHASSVLRPDGHNQPGSVLFGPSPDPSSASAAAEPVSFDGQTFLEVPDASAFDMTGRDFTISARLRTTSGGTIFAITRDGPNWVPDGQTLFVRDGHLGFDVGWVGAVMSRRTVNDGKWHQVAAVWNHKTRELRLYIDGREDARGTLAAKAPLPDAVVRIGYTAPDFPKPESFLTGDLERVCFHQRQLTDELRQPGGPPTSGESVIGCWSTEGISGDTVPDASGNGRTASVRRSGDQQTRELPIAAAFAPADLPLSWSADNSRLLLSIPPGDAPLRFTVRLHRPLSEVPDSGSPVVDPVLPAPDQDLEPLTHGGPLRWSQKLTTPVAPMFAGGPLETDLLTAPESNPWLAQTRFTGLDFFSDGRLAVCTWDGDVWIVEGPPAASQLTWQRIASGLFQPLGLKIVRDTIHVTCRDQLAVLHDLNGDRETDFIECLNNDHQVTEHFHEFAMGLQTDREGNFYYAKSGRHALEAVVPHHGTLLKITPDGSRTEILATGFRAANGVCLNPDGTFFVTDQEGFWNPKNRINRVTPGEQGRPRFYGNMFGYHDVTDTSDSAMEPPMCWITNAFDRSPGELVHVDSNRWGPLNGSLLNLSYGYGKVFLVLHETIEGQMQGGMIELPIPAFPTGVMRGRFHPQDEQLYLCGMFAWAGSATWPGGLYRIRAMDRPWRLPIRLQAVRQGLKLTFTEPLDPASVSAESAHVKVWSLKRTANYGSEHYDEHPLTIASATVSPDGHTVFLEIPNLQPTWCMEIRYHFRSPDQQPVQGTIHNTIHHVSD